MGLIYGKFRTEKTDESSSRRLKIRFKTMNIANMAPFHSLAVFVSLNQVFNVVAVQGYQLLVCCKMTKS